MSPTEKADLLDAIEVIADSLRRIAKALDNIGWGDV